MVARSRKGAPHNSSLFGCRIRGQELRGLLQTDRLRRERMSSHRWWRGSTSRLLLLFDSGVWGLKWRWRKAATGPTTARACRRRDDSVHLLLPLQLSRERDRVKGERWWRGRLVLWTRDWSTVRVIERERRWRCNDGLELARRRAGELRGGSRGTVTSARLGHLLYFCSTAGEGFSGGTISFPSLV